MWEDFEMEETQVKLDLTDMIMRDIVHEMAQIITEIDKRKMSESFN